ncbi:alanine dehydrogenase [Brevibacillus borstelensis]|uniref:alanine dehydrogenase n=1 Tax=Brevibacillus borstelensis TaxID=45462 RepID=UPI002E1C619F|nr:alanine dehydrogenase [Brevibacillus borstelensis]
MIIGTFKELKPGESRVVLTPTEVAELTGGGHTVLIGKGTGENAGFPDQSYAEAGAELRDGMEEIYAEAELIVKVKEILPEEYHLLREGQILFTCLHPAANREEVNVLLDKKVIAFTAEDTHQYGSPNGEVAGKLGALWGAHYLLSVNGGMGKLVGGIGGVPGIQALVIGAGIVGRSAANVLSSLGARVTMMDVNIGVLREAQYLLPKGVDTMFSNRSNIRQVLPHVDLVMNCVKWPKHRKDHLITREMLQLMRKKAVIVDISADVGGAVETYRPTTYEEPVYEVDGIIHFGVDNIPGAAPHTTSIAYAASVFPHIKSIADHGADEAARRNPYLRRGLTSYKGILTHEETALIQQRERTTAEELLGLPAK